MAHELGAGVKHALLGWSKAEIAEHMSKLPVFAVEDVIANPGLFFGHEFVLCGSPRFIRDDSLRISFNSGPFDLREVWYELDTSRPDASLKLQSSAVLDGSTERVCGVLKRLWSGEPYFDVSLSMSNREVIQAQSAEHKSGSDLQLAA